MSREIRRVPPEWEHPRYERDEPNFGKRAGKYKPLYDIDYETAADEWIAGFDLWRKGEHPDQKWATEHGYDYAAYFWDERRTPNFEYYRDRKWTPEEATAYQIYETVSEGTPVSPVFENLDEMRAWLLKQGYSPAAADGFIGTGWVPSGMFVSEGTDAGWYSDIEGAALFGRDEPKEEQTT